MLIIDNVKRLCVEHKTNFKRLEESIGLGNGTIGRWDKSVPNVDSLKKVADYFNVTVDALLRDYKD